MRVQDIIPVSIRKKLLKIHQSWIWPKAIQEYKNEINANRMPSKELIKKLVYAWGNQGFSAQIDYIQTCIEKTLKSEGLIFECGSGLSTILLGIIANKQNRKMVSFEHIDFWAKHIQKELDKNQMNNNTIYTRGLIDYGDFEWYDIEGLDKETVGLCICDAPPAATKGGRRGFLYLFKDFLLPNSIILVDDTIRDDEQKMIQEWEKELPMQVEFSGKFDPHAILTIR